MPPVNFRRNTRDGGPTTTNTNHASTIEPSAPPKFAEQSQTLIPAHVRMISGCHSEQTSADVSNLSAVAQLPNPAGKSGGACTSALLEILYRHKQPSSQSTLTFQQLLLELRKTLSQKGFDQIPQLTSSRPLDVGETPFACRHTTQPSGGSRVVTAKVGVCRALLVGINYRGQNGQLSGCHNDVLNVKQYLERHEGYHASNILLLSDDNGKHHPPTRQNITVALKQMVKQSTPGDSVYFHYSGHGGLLNPEWNAFKSGTKDFDETLFPLDHVRSGQIRDFDLYRDFVQPMAAGVLVTCVMDCCHSGAVLDLPYAFQPTAAGTIRMRRNMQSLSNLGMLYLMSGFMFPGGGLFDNVAQSIEHTAGGYIEDYQGTGMDENNGDFSGGNDDNNYDDVDNRNDYGADDNQGDYAQAGDAARGDGGYDPNTAGFDEGAGGVADTTDWNTADFGGTDTAWGASDADLSDLDCGCFADILGALLDN